MDMIAGSRLLLALAVGTLQFVQTLTHGESAACCMAAACSHACSSSHALNVSLLQGQAFSYFVLLVLAFMLPYESLSSHSWNPPTQFAVLQ